MDLSRLTAIVPLYPKDDLLSSIWCTTGYRERQTNRLIMTIDRMEEEEVWVDETNNSGLIRTSRE